MPVNFRQIIYELLAKKNISIAKLARKADLNHCTVYNYMNGQSEMTAANLENLLNTLESLPNRKQKKGVK